MPHGSFVAPHLIELSNAAQLTREEFGPILHVVRYRSDDMQKVLAAIRAQPLRPDAGRADAARVFLAAGIRGTSIGNTYVNRNMIGAVVGVQPFGGTAGSPARAQGRRPALPDALRQRANADRQYHGDRRQRGAAESRR